jgi:N-acetylglutamate synthase-like GNAT family acetyltransferase
MDYDKTDIATSYDRARSLAPETARLWQDLLSPYIHRAPTSLIIDLGCGTGRFFDLLATHFGVQVISIEPSLERISLEERHQMGDRNLAPNRIRNAEPSDLAVVRQISADAYITAYVPVLGYIPLPAEEDYGPRIARQEVWIIEKNGYAVGVAVLEESPDHLLVHSIAVRPTEQGRGYGKALLDFADQRAVELGVPEVRLFTNSLMQRNIALYRGHGYTEVDVRPHPNRSGQMVVDMVRPVRPKPP